MKLNKAMVLAILSGCISLHASARENQNADMNAIGPLANSASALDRIDVRNTEKYAEKITADYADEHTDLSPSGSRGCAQEGDLRNPVYQCLGIYTSLMHGGYPVKTKFICEIRFRENGAKFRLISAECDGEKL